MGTWWNDYEKNVIQGQSIYSDTPIINTDAIGAGVDMKEAELGLHAILNTGTLTDGTIDVKLQESADDGVSDPYTDINDFRTGGVAAFAQLVAADDNLVRALTFKRSKRYVRAFATGAGQTSGGRVAVSIHGLAKAINE